MEVWREFLTFCSFGVTYLSRKVLDWDGQGREKVLLDHVLEHAKQGDPQSVLQVIDDYARAGTWFMNLGFTKGQILDTALAKRKPQLVLELGTYCGYSAVRIASQLSEPGSKLITLELRPKVAEIARKIIQHAGLTSRVQVLLAPLGSRIEELKTLLSEGGKTSFDFVFIDHDKKCYLPDYLLLKNEGLLGEGSVVFTDNLGFPGSPEFLEYLRSRATELQTEFHKTRLEYVDWISDTVAVSTFKSAAA